MPANDREVPDGTDVSEEYSFDELAKGLAEGTITRRGALRVVGISFLGLVLPAFLAPGIAEARTRRHHHRAATATMAQSAGGSPSVSAVGPGGAGGRSPCGGACPPGTYCCPDTVSGGGGGPPSGGTCIEVKQTCPSAGCPNAGEVRCSGACTNVLSDVNNCGSCGNACLSGQSCVNGTCQVTCPIGTTFVPNCNGGAGECHVQTCTPSVAGSCETFVFCGFRPPGTCGGCFCVTTTEGTAYCFNPGNDVLGNCGCTSSQECEQSLGTGAVCANICANTSCAQGPGGVTQPVCTKRSPTTVCL